MDTLADADFLAFGADEADATTEGVAAGTPTEPRGASRTGLRVIGDSSPADAPSGNAAGLAGSAGVVLVVVVTSVVVPTSCAAEIAGTAQIAASTSIPLARALAPFIDLILWPATSSVVTNSSGRRI